MHTSLLASILLSLASGQSAQTPEGYRLPAEEVVRILDAPPSPTVRVSPDARWLLLVERPSMPTIADVARPWVGLAGVRIDPALGAPWRAGFDTGLVLQESGVRAGKEGEPQIRRIDLPQPAQLVSVSWSHDSRRFAFTRAGEAGIELWVADVDAAKPRRLAGRLDPVLTSAFGWMPDGSRLWCLCAPPTRTAAPSRPAVPTGPSVQETSGSKTPVRTYPDLLQDEFDAQLFEHFALCQLLVVDPSDGSQRAIGAPGLFSEVDPSPDARHWLVSRLKRPFSYVMPWERFPHTIEVWSADGKLEHTVADVPLGRNIPIEGVRTGPRSVQWHAQEDATLVWVEALDGGDPKAKAEFRDRWLAHAAPFAGEQRELFRLRQRAQGITWMAAPGHVLAGEYDRDRRWTRTLWFDLGSPLAAPRAIEDRSVNDRYGDPGEPLTRATERGTRVVRQDGDFIYRAGSGDSPEGARPFLDRTQLPSLASERLWRCEAGCYESLVELARTGTDRRPSFITVRQSPTEPPNWHLRDLGDAAADGHTSDRMLTHFPDPTPELRGITKQLVSYTRADGVSLSATLYLPAGYQKGTRLPLVVWAYPLEYNDAATAGQVSGSPFLFTRITGASQLFFLTQGYAVLDNASMPIVGDPETMNDAFLEQIVASAKAAIEKAVELGVADGKHVGIGGHSYGAFMTANLLAHCDLFQAGIARSGAYNRSLTPFGFQSERRTLWEAPEVYAKLSPFMHADQINEPLLMIHGLKDSNTGTFPMQSERLFQAIQGNGGTARLVELPEESHGYLARESVLHVLAEMFAWFDTYVKGAPGERAVEAGAQAPAEAK
jgi:dipeptidyl aminopeptidase/acylaminoacyl peptidase